MSAKGRHHAVWAVLAGTAWLLAAGCTTGPAASPGAADQPAETSEPGETAATLAMVRRVGWKEVSDLLPTLAEEPDVEFPGVAALADDLRVVSANNAATRGVPAVDVGQLLDHNPHFWRAYYEIAPGDPLMAMLHVGLLLAAGDAARADAVATLALSFGRMSQDYRQELVRLDAYAQYLLQVGRGDAKEPEWPGDRADFVALAAQAQSRLEVWPQNPAALADLAIARWGLAVHSRGEAGDAGKAAHRADLHGVAASLADLRRVDPFFVVDPRVAVAMPPTLEEARRLWQLVNEARSIGDEQVLRQFSAACAAARLDELALASHSLLAGGSTGIPPGDQKFIRRSLERLVGAKAAADICDDAFTEERDWIGFGTENDLPAPDREGASIHPQLEQRFLVQIAEASYWIESGLLKGADLADNFSERGEAWAALLQTKDAVADLRHALELGPDNNGLKYSLAVTLSDSGDFQAADGVFAEAMKRAPPSALEAQAWGNHLFKQARFAEAEAAYVRAAKLAPDFAYARIMRRLAQVRQGKAGGARATSQMKKQDPWGASLLDFVGGRIDRPTLFGRLEPKGGLRYSEEECELYFVLAEQALSRGDVAEARRNLHSCLGTGITDFVEYALAWHELRRLNAVNPPPAEKKGQSDDMADEEPV
jgi:lipoprotein NlpI